MEMQMVVDQSHNVGNECSYLGCLLLMPSLISEICLCPADFYNNLNKEVFKEILIHKEKGMDIEFMAECMGNRTGWDSDDLLNYFEDLVEGTPGITNFKAYEAIIREKSVYRMIMEIQKELEAERQYDAGV